MSFAIGESFDSAESRRNANPRAANTCSDQLGDDGALTCLVIMACTTLAAAWNVGAMNNFSINHVQAMVVEEAIAFDGSSKHAICWT